MTTVDLLLHRYHSLDYFLSLDFSEAVQLLNVAATAERDDRMWLQWAVQLPVMAFAGEYISLEDYKARVTGANVDTRPTAAILAELDEVEAKFKKEVTPGGA